MSSAVQHRRFRPLWTASILSGIAYVTALTARGWAAFDLHHHSSTVGLVVFASFLPFAHHHPLAALPRLASDVLGASGTAIACT